MSPALRALIVEDSETDAKLVLRALRVGGRAVEFERVENEPAMRAALARGGWDFVVSDWSLPRFSGSAALAVTNETGLDLPFILVSGTIGEEAAVAMMRAGAKDFVLKANLARLAPVLERELAERDARAARRRAESDAIRIDARYRCIVEATSQGVWILDRHDRASFVNRRMAEMLGLEVAEILGRPIFDFVVEGHHAGTRRRLRDRRSGVPGPPARVCFRKNDGGVLVTLVESTQILDETTKDEGLLGLITDVTERDRTDAALRVSQARFERLSAAGILGIATGDASGKLLDANDAFISMLGHSRADCAAGRLNWKSMTPPEWEAADAIAMARVAEVGVAVPWEKEFFRKDGTRVPGVALLEGTQSIAFTLDLTERKRADAALRRSEEELRQYQKMEAIGQLASGIAHDFNNLLTVIDGYCAMTLGALPAGTPPHNWVTVIAKASERAAGLTRQLLAFSRSQVLQPQVLDLNALVEESVLMLRRVIRENVTLVTLPQEDLGRVNADPGQLDQVLLNLAVNARDAMPDGGTLTIETTERSLDAAYAELHEGLAPGRYVCLAMSDTGMGMDAATLPRIFEPFFTTKELGCGTGLGLSTVYGIVKQSGGHVTVNSELGIGTTIQVLLPRVEEHPVKPTSEGAPPGIARGDETVLVVEDDDAVRSLVRAVLERSGYVVLEACGGDEALALICGAADTVDLLLTDMVMPGMSGACLAQKLAALGRMPRVLYMSGFSDVSLASQGAIGSDGPFIQKPFTADALLRCVRDTIRGPAPSC